MLNLLFLWLLALYSSDAKKQLRVWPVRLRRDSGAENTGYPRNVHGLIEKGYYVEVLIGTPPQTLNVVIDTGSSNFAVASTEHQLVTKVFDSMESSTLRATANLNVGITYTEGFWNGPLVTDIVTIPSANLTESARVSIVEITSSQNFFINGSKWQGILGLAYSELVQPNNLAVKSFMQSVVEDTGIDDIFSLQLCMANVHNNSDSVSGTFAIGGYHLSSDKVYWTTVVRKWYYDVLILGMKVGNTSVTVPCSSFNNDKAIVDSGTSNLKFPRKVFDIIVLHIKEHVSVIIPDKTDYAAFWQGNEVLCWNSSIDLYKLFPSLTVYLPSNESHHTIALMVHPEHYILFVKNDNNEQGRFCCKFGISPSSQGTVLGAVLMEEYVVIFDRANEKVGFSISDCSSTARIQHFRGFPNITACHHLDQRSSSATRIALYALVGIFLLCLLPVCILSYLWCRKRNRLNTGDDLNNLIETSS